MSANEISTIALKLGTVLNGRYEIEGVLGAGGFGLVYRAVDRVFEKTVVIKEFLPADIAARGSDGASVVPRTVSDSDVLADGVSAFLGEARRLHGLPHRNIVEVSDFVSANGTGYLVMPYQKGETLSDLLSRSRTLPGEELKDLLLQVLAGLDYVHKNEILHRDISPGNLFIRQDGTVLLIDFGASRQVVGDRSRSLSTIVKPGYAPFEQYHTRGKQGPWSDLYALAATAYRCVTGSPPPDATERMELTVDASSEADIELSGSKYAAAYQPEVLEFIDRSLALQTSARPQSVAEAMAILQPATSAAASNGALDDPFDRASAEVQRSWEPASLESFSVERNAGKGRKLAAASIIAVLIVGASILGWFLRPSSPGELPRVALSVVSRPADAEVRVNGESLGRTPLESNIAIGSHRIEIALDGYLPLQRNFVARSGERSQLEFDLIAIAAEPAFLIVRSNVTDDRLEIDTNYVGPTGPRRHEVTPGEHLVRVSKPYHSDWSTAVELDTNEERTLMAELFMLPNSCEYAYDNECDEPGSCPVGTDTADCRLISAAPNGDDSCRFALDGRCDEGKLCALGTDATDCAVAIDFGDDSSLYANDGECDDPRFEAVFGTGMAAVLIEADTKADASDCRRLFDEGRIRLR